ncbi:MAG TPA: VOC family protein [Chitinophagaceae bacterium]|nr:VOC family protein [Chitinophagaceae bacterium]
MRLLNLTPMLWTANLEGTMEFYATQLGFTISNYNEEWGWVHLNRDGAGIMFALPNTHEAFDKPACTGTFYFYCDEVDNLWEKLKDPPFVYYGIENFEYGMREFAIKDNNGYILQFGCEIVQYKKNIANNA